MKENLYFYIFFIFSYINISMEYLVLPFKYLNNKKSKEYNFNDISGKDFLEFSTNKLVSSILVGTPYKPLELYITMDYKLFFIGKGYCQKDSKSLYEPSYSSTYTNKSFYLTSFDDLRDITIGNDLITVYNDYNLKSNITLKSVQLYYGNMAKTQNNNNPNNNICGIMGFKLHSNDESYYNKFTTLQTILKSNNITNYTYWTIEFFNEKIKKSKNNYDGYLILGAADNKYLKEIKNISSDEIQYSYSSTLSSSIEWMVHFQSIFYYYSEDLMKKMDYDLSKVEFNIDIDYYFSTKEYIESIKTNFFEKYLSKGICKINKLKEFYLRYQFITCDKSFNDELKNFPALNFVSTYYNHTFELTYKDLFKEIKNGFIFLMFYNPWNPKNFMFGKNFMTKYNFIFRYDQKNIGFLNYIQQSDEKEKNQETIKNKIRFEIIIVIALSILLIGIIIAIFVVRKRLDKKRKKRTNELDDEDYDYDDKNEAING